MLVDHLVGPMRTAEVSVATTTTAVATAAASRSSVSFFKSHQIIAPNCNVVGNGLNDTDLAFFLTLFVAIVDVLAPYYFAVASREDWSDGVIAMDMFSY